MPEQDQTPPQDDAPKPDPSPPTTKAPKPAPETRRSPVSGFVAALLGGAIAAGGGFAVSHLDVFKLRPDTDAAANALAEVAALKTELAALRTEVEGAAGQVAPVADAAAAAKAAADAARTEAADAAAALDKRVSEAVMAQFAVNEEMTGLVARIDALDAALKTAASQPSTDGSVTQSALAAVANTVESLKAELAALKSSAQLTANDAETLRAMAREEVAAWDAANTERLKAEREAAALAAAKAKAAAALGQAIETGAPYAADLATLGAAEVPEVVTRFAETGIPTLATLIDGFADPARKALNASITADAGDNLGDRAWAFLRIQTGARSLTPREGSDPDAVLSRAEAALRDGKVADALKELEALPPAGQAEMEAWVAVARDHLAAAEALTALTKP